MTITNTWLVEQMTSYPEKDGYSDVVFTVNWRVNANDGNYSATTYGSIGVTLDPEAPFTPYAQLTQEQVVGWVQSAMGAEQVAAIEFNLTTQIGNLINPPTVTLPNPWVAPQE